MALGMGSPSLNNGEIGLSREQERTNELENKTANLSAIEQKLDKVLEQTDVFAKYPDEIQAVLKEALVEKCYLKHGEDPDIRSIGKGVSPTTQDNFIDARVGAFLSTSILPDKIIADYAQKHPYFDLEGLKSDLHHQELEQTFKAEKSELQNAFQEANNKRLMAVDQCNKEIANASLWDKMRGNVPDPIPSVKEQSLYKEEVLKYADPKMAESETFQNMLDEMVTRLDESATREMGAEFWDTLQLPPNKDALANNEEDRITANLQSQTASKTITDDESTLKMEVGGEYKVINGQMTVKANGEINYDYATEPLTANIHVNADVTKVSDQATDYTINAGGTLKTSHETSENGELTSDLGASHTVTPNQNTTKANAGVNYDYTTEPLTANAHLNADITKVSDQASDYTINAGGTLKTSHEAGENGKLTTDFGASHEVTPNQNTTKANAGVNYDYTTEPLTANAHLNADITKVSDQASDYTINAGGTLKTSHEAGENGKLTTDFGVSHEVTPNQNTTKANAGVNYDYTAESLTGNAHLNADVTKVSDQASDYTINAGGTLKTSHEAGENGKITTDFGASHEVTPNQNITKANAGVNYDYTTDPFTANVHVNGNMTKVSDQKLDYNIGIGGSIQTIKDYGDHASLKVEMGGMHEIKPNQNTTKANVEVNYDYTTDLFTANVHVNGDMTKVSDQKLDYNIGIGGSIQTIKDYGDYASLKVEIGGKYEEINGINDFKILSGISYTDQNWEAKATGEFGRRGHSTTIQLNYNKDSATEFNLYFRNEQNQLNGQRNRHNEIGIGFKMQF